MRRTSRTRVSSEEMTSSGQESTSTRQHSSRRNTPKIASKFGWSWTGLRQEGLYSESNTGSWDRIPKLPGYRNVVGKAKSLQTRARKLPFVIRGKTQAKELREEEVALAEATAKWTNERVQCQVRDIAATSQRVARVAVYLSIRYTEAFIAELRSEAQRRNKETEALALYKELVERYAQAIGQSVVDSVMTTVLDANGLKRLIQLKNEMAERQARTARVHAHWKSFTLRLEGRLKMQLYLKGMCRTASFWSNFDIVRNRRIEASAVIKWCLSTLNARRRRTLRILTQQSLVFGIQKGKVYQKWNKRLYLANQALQKLESQQSKWTQRRVQSRAGFTKRYMFYGRKRTSTKTKATANHNSSIVVGITKYRNNKFCGYRRCKWKLVSQPLTSALCQDAISHKRPLCSGSALLDKNRARVVHGQGEHRSQQEQHCHRIESVI